MGKSFVELWQSREKALGVIKALQNKGRWIGEMVAVKKNGSTLDIHLLASIIIDESGKPVSMLFSFVKTANNAIAFSDLKGNLTYVNNSFLKLWGYDDDAEILGNPFVELWQMEEKALQIIKALRNKGEWIGELAAVNGIRNSELGIRNYPRKPKASVNSRLKAGASF